MWRERVKVDCEVFYVTTWMEEGAMSWAGEDYRSMFGAGLGEKEEISFSSVWNGDGDWDGDVKKEVENMNLHFEKFEMKGQ